MRILVVTDAWHPQINGVVRTLDTVRRSLAAMGHAVEVLSPDGFRTLPCPSYPEIRLAVTGPGAVARRIEAAAPDAIHIATEGPLGFLARRHCLRQGHPFTTSLHTRFPEYIAARWRVPPAWSYTWLRRFHRPAVRTMVATASMRADLAARGFAHLVRWSRGVDTALFRPRDDTFLPLARPISLYVGRVAVEKNIEAFLALELPGSKVVVGDGPLRPTLEQRHPGVHFAGVRTGEDLARHYAAADVFVFPSRTDTFGLVILEALAAGVPVAAYPVTGPRDILDGSGAGVLDEDLAAAVRGALSIPRERCRVHAERYSWQASARAFLANLAPLR
jgi:glycosyltransferase involved in cell wall biosynthesis